MSRRRSKYAEDREAMRALAATCGPHRDDREDWINPVWLQAAYDAGRDHAREGRPKDLLTVRATWRPMIRWRLDWDLTRWEIVAYEEGWRVGRSDLARIHKAMRAAECPWPPPSPPGGVS